MARTAQQKLPRQSASRQLWERHRQLQQHQQQELESYSQERHAHNQRHHQALDLPEVFFSISRFLDSYSILQCLHVCKQWHTLLLPSIWSKVKLNSDWKPVFGGQRHQDDPFAFLKHAYLVQELEIYSFASDLTLLQPDGRRLIHCVNLSTLIINIHWAFDDNDDFYETDVTNYGLEHSSRKEMEEQRDRQRSSLIEIIRLHQRTLEVLKLSSRIFSKELLDVIAGCPRLRRLEHSETFIDLDKWTTQQYEQLWSNNLEVLYLNQLTLKESSQYDHHTDTSIINYSSIQGLEASFTSAEPISAITTAIQDLSIDMSVVRPKFYEVPLRMILSSPKLTRLSWTSSQGDNPYSTTLAPMAYLAQAVRLRGSSNGSSSDGDSGDGDSLSVRNPVFSSRLAFLCMRWINFATEDFETLIGASPSLTGLELSLTNFDDQCLQILMNQDHGRYQSTLTELNLEGCREVTGKLIQEILCSFSGLRIFKADNLCRCDLVLLDEQGYGHEQGEALRPWICLGLKELSLFFDRSSGEPPNDEIFEGYVSDGDDDIVFLEDESGMDEFHISNEDENEEKKGQEYENHNGDDIDDSVHMTSDAVPSSAYYVSNTPGTSTTSMVTTESLVFSRLSTLEQLEILDLNVCYVPRAYRILQLTLKGGLDQLRTLKRLKVLHGPDFRNQTFFWTEKEALWVLEHWPRLQTMTSVALDETARRILVDRGIDCRNCLDP
ncbi:hypothetical protein BGZ83_007697 [Gryganskiella cystojenkinii]|nr:hypothetical protein BGZ83_007697 [Gryganskiella cystojenkinii]